MLFRTREEGIDMEEKHSGGSGAGAAPISAGTVWFIGWLFTLGFAQLPFWKAVLAILLWPYYLGSAMGVIGS